jgi:hypothetical protein
MVAELGLMWLPIGVAILSILVAVHTWYKSSAPILHHDYQSHHGDYDAATTSKTPTSYTPVGPPGLMHTPPVISAILKDVVLRYRLQNYSPPWYGFGSMNLHATTHTFAVAPFQFPLVDRWLASGHLQTMFSAQGWHVAPRIKYLR